ncbi:MAG: chorismate lyase [Candidatus Accumulibacter sp.]|nr:chorismate lyase [Accumulibacter sp.]
MPASTNSLGDRNRRAAADASTPRRRWSNALSSSGAGDHLRRDWLRDRGSLTARLQQRGTFAVRVLRQGLAIPTDDEALVLQCLPGRRAWIREVTLYCAGRRVVFAHTVLPYRPRGVLTRWLARLGNRSLGAMLFSHAGIRRGRMQFKRLDARHPLFALAWQALDDGTGTPCHLWARRSEFSFRAQTVLVTEIFSPTLLSRR